MNKPNARSRDTENILFYTFCAKNMVDVVFFLICRLLNVGAVNLQRICDHLEYVIVLQRVIKNYGHLTSIKFIYWYY